MSAKSIKVFRFLAMFSGALLAFAILLDIAVYGTWKDILRPHVISFDGVIINAIRIHSSETMNEVMLFISKLGSFKFYVTFGGAVVIWLCLKKKAAEGIMLIVCSGGSGLMTLLLKDIVMRFRPDMMPVIVETGYSFPSGHSVTAVCFYGYLAFLYWVYGDSPALKKIGILTAAFMILIIGISRIYLGVHFPTDVIGGYITGLMWLSLSVLVLYHKKQKRLSS